MSDRDIPLPNSAFRDMAREQNRRLHMGQSRVRYPGSTKVVTYGGSSGPPLVKDERVDVLSMQLDPGRWLVLGYGQFVAWSPTGPTARWRGIAELDDLQSASVGGAITSTNDFYPGRYPVELHAVYDLAETGWATLRAVGQWSGTGTSGMRFPYAYMVAYPI